MKINKNKKKLTIILGASALALTTVGFASWVITGTTPINKQQVEASFGAVTDNSILGSLETGSDLALNFDAVKNSQGEIQSTDGTEDMSFTIKYKFVKGDKATKFTAINFTIVDNYDTLVTGNYIVRPYSKTANSHAVTMPTVAGTKTYVAANATDALKEGTSAATNAQEHKVTLAADLVTYTFESTFRFKWGSAFENKNPAVADDTSSKVADLKTNLKNFKAAYTALNANKNVSVTITPVQ